MSSMVRSPSSENLSEDMLRAEVKTVALDWKSLRHVLTCSCATPFDYYVKKVSAWMFLLIFLSILKYGTTLHVTFRDCRNSISMSMWVCGARVYA